MNQSKTIKHNLFAEKIGQMVYEALIEEANLTPKPGLVDCYNNGAHTDMDITLFHKSASALSIYMPDFVLLGAKLKNTEPEKNLSLIRPLGIECEKAMFDATDGINTHKGAIFAFGLICTAIGRLWEYKNPCPQPLLICNEVALMCNNITEKEFNAKLALNTAGYKIFKNFGFSGARGEAQSGFATIFLTALPIYNHLMKENVTKEYALLQTLLSLISVNNDTNVMSRGGIDGLKWIKSQADNILKKNAVFSKNTFIDLILMDQHCIEKNISPGGSADLLAVTYFLYELQSFSSFIE